MKTEAEHKAENEKAVSEHDAVNAWLRALAESDPAEFERVRVLPYAEQKKRAGVA